MFKLSLPYLRYPFHDGDLAVPFLWFVLLDVIAINERALPQLMIQTCCELHAVPRGFSRVLSSGLSASELVIFETWWLRLVMPPLRFEDPALPAFRFRV